MKPLTKKQAAVLDFIKAYAVSNQCPPTQAEINAAFGFASNFAAQYHIAVLCKKNLIRVVPHTARGIRILEAA